MADPTVIGLRLYVERDNLRAQQTYASLGMSEEPYFLMGLYPLPGKESAFGLRSPKRKRGSSLRQTLAYASGSDRP